MTDREATGPDNSRRYWRANLKLMGLIFVYAAVMKRLDRKYGVGDRGPGD